MRQKLSPEDGQVRTSPLNSKSAGQQVNGFAFEAANGLHDNSKPPAVEPADSDRPDLKVYDIIGAWGLYQTSLTLFGVLTSSLLGMTVVVGPMWTPDMGHLCADGQAMELWPDGGGHHHRQQCQLANETRQCERFIYDDQAYGQVLTNSFDLVCDRKWLRSTLTSSTLTGMLLSSITLGQVSDRYGRMSCVGAAYGISILATAAAALVSDYFLLNLCFMLMAYAQAGASNALSALVMESTSPRWRFVSVFELEFGWGLGMLFVPILHWLTMDYRLYLWAMLLFQLLLLVWLKFGAFESIRWLLSEGHIHRAQIELQRACRFNRVRQGARLAQRIAQVQVQQVERASSVLQRQVSLSPAPGERLPHTEQRLDAEGPVDKLDATLRRSMRSFNGQLAAPEVASPHLRCPSIRSNTSSLSHLSPTLARKSFSLSRPGGASELRNGDSPSANKCSSLDDRDSITTQRLVQMVLGYSKTVEQADESGFFLVRMFHRKLYKLTLMLMLVVVMSETAYYGLMEANKFAGPSVSENYIVGAFFTWLSCCLYAAVSRLFSRKVAVVMPLFVGALVCLSMALNYHLIPGQQLQDTAAGERLQLLRLEQHNGIHLAAASRVNNSAPQEDFVRVNDTLALEDHYATQPDELIVLREDINFWLMLVAKLAFGLLCLIVVETSLESFPNNLRQTATAAIFFVARLGSIAAPFMFNDPSETRGMLKGTLVGLAAMGFVSCTLVPFFLRDNKDKDLCDHMNDIAD